MKLLHWLRFGCVNRFVVFHIYDEIYVAIISDHLLKRIDMQWNLCLKVIRMGSLY